jgi:hypothetical protein
MQVNATMNQNSPTEPTIICYSCKELRRKEELSECPGCGELFCGFRSSNCKTTCACGPTLEDVEARIAKRRKEVAPTIDDVIAKLEALSTKRKEADPVPNAPPPNFDIAEADKVIACLDAFLAKRGASPATA